jgi:hypothetical protein
LTHPDISPPVPSTINVDTIRQAISSADQANANRTDEAVEVASQWAQEKLDNFLLEVG